jgi:predicted aminopeptidase
MHYPDLDIARLIFHELAHQVAYARDDTTFNESYAVAVEEEGLRRWVQREATPAQLVEYERFRLRQKELVALLMRGRAALKAVYAGERDDASKRTGKAQALASLLEEYRRMRAGWNLTEAQERAYNNWFERDLNNARLGSVAVYTEWVPAFARMIEEERGNMPAFHARVKALAELPRAERIKRLKQTIPSSR